MTQVESGEFVVKPEGLLYKVPSEGRYIIKCYVKGSLISCHYGDIIDFSITDNDDIIHKNSTHILMRGRGERKEKEPSDNYNFEIKFDLSTILFKDHKIAAFIQNKCQTSIIVSDCSMEFEYKNKD